MQAGDSRSRAGMPAADDGKLRHLLLVYFLVRVIGSNVFAWLVPRSSWEEWFWPIDLALFGLTAAMIRSGAGRLEDFHIDRASLWVFLTFGTVFHMSRRRGISVWIALEFAFYFFVAIWLIVSLRRTRGFPRRGLPSAWAWIAVALSVLLSWAFLSRLEMIAEASASTSEALPTGYSIAYLILAFARGMGSAAILEEPAFRGFLMGFWQKAGLNPTVILIGQAALFMLAHLRSIENPIFFWIGLPLGGLVFGWLAWKSRSVAASMVVHASFNALVSIS